MKLGVDTPKAITSNVESHGAFRITASAKAFSILSSSLYSNKIKAIVRELSCNALDSHKEAGKLDVPFVVHLPNSIDPFFSVTDFGVGIDHEGITQIYTTYFESTKTDSNDYIGALGLGSKTPFSYTDNFTVTAIQDGVQRIYSAYIDDSGCPAIAKMGECETDASNGVEVKFPVNSNDFHKFQREAQSVFKWFAHRPEITGSMDFEVGEVDYKERDLSEGVDLKADGYTAIAVQGSIAYPLNVPDTDEWGALSQLLSCPLVIAFEIGDLDIAASREELSYDKRTIANIKARLEIIAGDVADFVSEQVADITNQWELAYRLKELNKDDLFKAGVAKFVDDGGCELLRTDTRYGGLRDNGDFLHFPVKELADRGLILRIFKVQHNWSGTKISDRKPEDKTVDKEVIKVWKIPTNKQMMFITNDSNQGMLAKMRHHFKNTRRDDELGGSFTIVTLDVDRDKRELRSDLYRQFFRDLKRPPHKHLAVGELLQRDRLEHVRTNLLVTEQRHYKGQRRCNHTAWAKVSKDETFDDNETYYYVPVNNFTILDKDGEGIYNFFENTWSELMDVEILPTRTLYGVRKSHIKTVQAETNWICIYDVLPTLVAGFDKTEIERYLAAQVVDSELINRYTIGLVNELDTDSVFAEFGALIEDAIMNSHKNHSFITSARALLKDFGDNTDFDAYQSGIRKEYSTLVAAYPMLGFITNSYSGADTERSARKMIDYIILIDNAVEVGE